MYSYYIILALIVAGAIFVTFDPRFERPGYEGWRAGMFLVMGMYLPCALCTSVVHD
jgi:hypothetical protein